MQCWRSLSARQRHQQLLLVVLLLPCLHPGSSCTEGSVLFVEKDLLDSQHDPDAVAAYRTAESMHFWDGRCNPLRHRGWSYVTQGVESLDDITWAAREGFDFRPFTPPTPTGPTPDADDLAWIRTSFLSASHYGAAWVKRVSQDTPLTDVWVTVRENAAELYLDEAELGRLHNPPWWKLSSFDHWSFYKRNFPETSFPIARHVLSAADVWSDHTHVAFTQDNTDATTAGYLKRIVTLVNLAKKVVVPLDFPCTPSSPTAAGGERYQLSPMVAGDWVVVQVWESATSTLTIALHDLFKGTRDVISHTAPEAAGSRVAFNPFLWNATKEAAFDFGWNAHAYLLHYDISFSGGATPLALGVLDNTTYGVSLRRPASVDSVSIAITELPSRLRCTIPPSGWQVLNTPVLRHAVHPVSHVGIRNFTEMRDFTELRSSVGAGGWVFSVISSPAVPAPGGGGGIASPALQAIAAVRVSPSPGTPRSGDDNGFATQRVCPEPFSAILIAETVTAGGLRILSNFHTGVLVGAGDNATRYAISAYHDSSGKAEHGEAFSVCRLFDPQEEAEVGATAAYQDTLLYQRRPVSGQGGWGVGVLPDGVFAPDVEYVHADFDKDNDGAWDVADRYPLDPLFCNDTDNDGIGDAGDLVPMYGSCRDNLRGNPGSCTNDLVILYSAWAGFSAVLVIICASVGLYRKRHLDDLYQKRKVTAREWIDRQWRESVRHDIPEQELFTLMAEIDERIQSQEGFRGELIVQTVLFLLTIISVGLWVVAMWRSNASLKFVNTLAWIDLYTSTIFLVDLAYRWFFRIEGEYKNFKDYCIKNWYDFPSLVTDIPGLTGTGTLGILVVARLIRVLRIFKMFRVVRLYHRVTQQQAILALILRYDTVWQTAFVCGLIISLGVIIKLIEQHEQAVFDPYENVLWFCIVTVTTIGYGGMVPVNPISRVLAVFLMVSGIGIIGVLTASMGKSVRDSGIDKKLLQERMRKIQEGKWRLSLELLRYSVMYNPILAQFRPYERGLCAHPSCRQETRVIDTSTKVIKTTFENSRYHADCFRCSGCSGPRRGDSGACWVVPEYISRTQPNVTRRRRTASILGEADPDEHADIICPAQVFLHKRCLRRARGGGAHFGGNSPHASEQADVQSHSSIGDALVTVEELCVKGLFGVAGRFNGTYSRRVTGHECSPVIFDHDVSGLATITFEDRAWKLLFRMSTDIETCAGTSPFLVGSWGTPHSLSKLYGCPVVEDLGSQLHYWHLVYDPLDMPVRNLVVNYASTRTRQQFSHMLEHLHDEAAPAMSMGKFGAAIDMPDRSTTAEHIQHMDRLRYQIKVACELDESRARLGTPAVPSEKLTLLLRTHKLMESGKVKNFDLMRDHLDYLIYKKNADRPCGTTLAKVFAIRAQHEAGFSQNRYKTDSGIVTDLRGWDEGDYDWTDTVEWTLHEVDRCLVDHGVDLLPQYSAVRIELENLVLSYDRVLMCRWAWSNLSWKNWHEGAVRPLKMRMQMTDMPTPPPGRVQYAEYEASLLDPLADNLERHQIEKGKGLAAASLLTGSTGCGGPATQGRVHHRASSMESLATVVSGRNSFGGSLSCHDRGHRGAAAASAAVPDHHHPVKA